MANTIRLKSGSGSNPSASDLVVGEVALRTDGNPKLFTKNDAGSVLEVGLDSLNDKLPLAGGTLSGNVILNDNVKALFGTGSDFQIYHDGNNGVIDNNTGDLYITTVGSLLIQGTNNDNVIKYNSNGAVELYYDNSKKFFTIASGVQATNRIIVGEGTAQRGLLSGDANSVSIGSISDIPLNFNRNSATKARIDGNNFQIPNDSGKIQLGASQDLSLYHDASKSVIADTGTGGLFIAGSSISLTNAGITETMLYAVPNGAVNLYYDNSSKLETNSTGIATDTIRLGGMKFPRTQPNNGLDFMTFGHGGTNSFGELDWLTGMLRIKSGEIRLSNRFGNVDMINCFSFGAVELFHNGTKRIETTSTGATVTGTLTATTFSGSGASLTNIPAGQLTGTLPALDGSNLTGITVSNANTIDNLDSTQFLRSDAADTASGDITFTDNTRAKFGTGGDLSIYHDGTHSYIENATGGLYIKVGNGEFLSRNGTEVIAKFIENSDVELYYDNSKKFETKSTGVGVTGNLEVGSGQITCGVHGTTGIQIINDGTFGTLHNVDLTFRTHSTTRATIDTSGNFNIPNDSGKIRLGASQDLEIYHDGSHSRIDDAGTGALIVSSSKFQINNAAGNEVQAFFLQNGASALYYDNSKKLHTDSFGVVISGGLALDGDNLELRIGNGQDLKIYHDGSDSIIYQDGTGDLRIRSDNSLEFNTAGTENAIWCDANAAVKLYYDNSLKLKTTSSGVDVDGSVTADDIITAGALLHEGDTNTLVHFDANDQISLKTNGSTRLQVVNTGINVTGNIELSTHLDMPDSAKIKLGTGDDLQLYHSGTDSRIINSNSDLFIYTVGDHDVKILADSQNAVICKPDASVELYYDNSKKFETTSVGTHFNGTIHTILGDFYPSNDNNDRLGLSNRRWSQVNGYEFNASEFVKFFDNIPAKFGDGDDLRIYHDGNNHINTTSGYLLIQVDNENLYLDANQVRIRGEDGGETLAKFIDDGAVELYYDGSKKLDTRNGGVGISGDLFFIDSSRIYMGSSNDFKFFHDGSNSHIQNSTGSITVRTAVFDVLNVDGSERMMRATANAGCDLFFNGVSKLETRVGDTIFHDDIRIQDNNKINIGTLDDLQIYHDATHSRIHNNTGALLLETDNHSIQLNKGTSENMLVAYVDGTVNLYFDNSLKFQTTSIGATVTGSLTSDELKLGNSEVLRWGSNDSAFIRGQDGSSGYMQFGVNNVQMTISRNGIINLPDNNKITFGADHDLQLYHSGTNTYISNSTGTLFTLTDTFEVRGSNANETHFKTVDNGSVSLYYDNSEKLYTTADGIESKGELHFKSPSNFNGEQTGRIEWWNENDAGVMAKIGVDRKSSTGAPADLVFSTNQNVDTSANGSDGDITERGRFSNNGLRLTNQPCFYAYSNVTRNNYGGGIVVAYTATHHNQGNHYSTSTYRFTAPVDGIYVFGGNPGYVESGQTYSLYLRINGAVRTEVGRVVQGNFPSHSQFGFSVSVKLSANDYVDLYQLGRMHHNASYSAWWGYFLG